MADSLLILSKTTFDWASERSKTDLLPGIVLSGPFPSFFLKEDNSNRRSSGFRLRFLAIVSRK